MNSLRLSLTGLGLLVSFIGFAQTWEVYDENFKLKSRVLNDKINFISDQIRVGTFNNEVRLLNKNFQPFLNLNGHTIHEYIEPWIIVEGKDGFGAFHEYGEEIFSTSYDEIQTFYTRILAKKGSKYYLYDRTSKTTKMIGEFESAVLAKNGQVIAKANQGLFLPLSKDPNRLYSKLEDINENFILSSEPSGFGLINRAGEYVLEPIIDKMIHLEDDYFYALDGREYMLIKGREEKVDINYTSYHEITLKDGVMLEYIHGKLRRVMKNDGILLDMTGMETVKAVQKDWYNIYTREKKVGLLGINGWAVKPIEGVEAIYPGSEKLFPALKSGKFGFINESGEWKVKHQFDAVKKFSNGLAAVQINGLWGYINNQGTIIIGPNFSDAQDFHRGIASVSNNDKSYLISLSGEIITESGFDKISLLRDNYYLTELNGGFGLINGNGQELLSPKYDEVRRESSDMILVRKNQKYGIINEAGEFILPLHYHAILFDHASNLILAEDSSPIIFIDSDQKGSKKRRSE